MGQIIIEAFVLKRLQELNHRQITLTREAAEVAAVLQNIHMDLRRIRHLHQGDFIRGDFVLEHV